MAVRWRLLVVGLVTAALVLVMTAGALLPSSILPRNNLNKLPQLVPFRPSSSQGTNSRPADLAKSWPTDLKGSAKETYKPNEVCELPQGFPDHPLTFEEAKKFLLHEGPEKSAFKIVPCPNGKQVKGCESTFNFPRFAKLHEPYRDKFFDPDYLAKRRTMLDKLASEQWKREWGPLILLSINKGYLFLFGNWVCSCKRQGLDISARTLVITGDDEETAIEVQRLGFRTISSTWYLPEHPHWKIQPNAPIRFSMGSHMATNLLGASLAADFIMLGYDVLLQDVDLVWLADPFAYLNTHPTINNLRMDITMMDDGRRDKVGPGNAGFIVLRSNCRTKIFMESYVKNSHFIEFGGRSDQRYWNGLLASDAFIKMRYGLLPLEEFANGHVLKPLTELSDKCLVLHASYTGTIFKKIRKLDTVGHWLYTADRCPLFNPKLDPFELPEWRDDPFTLSAYMQVELSTLQGIVNGDNLDQVKRLKDRLFKLESLLDSKVSAAEKLVKSKEDTIISMKNQIKALNSTKKHTKN